ncbi:MAG: hypothetical protein U0Z44_17760 [Kouleothrix sp.]
MTLFRARNVADVAQVRALTAALQRAAAAAGRPPLLICADQEGGQLMAIDGGMPASPATWHLAPPTRPSWPSAAGRCSGASWRRWA